MEHRRYGSPNKQLERSGGIGTALFIILSVALVAGIIVFSPIGDRLIGKPAAEALSCQSKNGADEKIVSALKNQDGQTASPQPSPSEKVRKELNVEETPFYILQMGAFLAEEDAVQHADEIQRIGAGGTVFKDGSVYRVFAAAYTNEESLMKVHAQVRNDGFEASPYITEKKLLKITLDGDSGAADIIEKSIQLLDKVPTDLSGLCIAFDKGEHSLQETCRELETLEKNCEARLKEIQTIRSATVMPILELLTDYQQKISTFLKEHDTIEEKMMSGALKRLQLSVITDYILFFDQE